MTPVGAVAAASRPYGVSSAARPTAPPLSAITCSVLTPARAPRLADHPDPPVLNRLRQAKGGARRVGRETHVTLGGYLHGFQAHRAARRGHRRHRRVDVGGAEVGGPVVRGLRLRPASHQTGDAVAILGGID